MSVGVDLVGAGYLPDELPPNFSSTSLGTHVASLGLAAATASITGGSWTRPVRHNLARPGGLRRVLTIPNPINYIRVAQAIDDGWSSAIRPLLARTTIASSRPTHVAHPRAFAPFNKDSAEWKARARSGARYILRTDIQNFYPSIYTHSIPWALHTKATAKAQKTDPALLGNRIDKAFREGQDGQTMGLPIGPNASWVIAECILAVVETELVLRLGPLRGHRYIDDWELAYPSIADAETALSVLQEVLSAFELTLNPRKTEIRELPFAIEEEGIGELRRWQFSSTPKSQRTDIIHYFDRVTELVQANRGGHVASYAIARLRTEPLQSATWQLLEAQLLSLLVAEPSSAKQVATTVSMLVAAGHTLTKAAVTHATEQIAARHGPLSHGSEIAWALWLSLANRIHLTQPTLDALSKMDDPVVALLALDAQATGLLAGTLQTAQWAQLMTTDDLRGPHWILSYEAGVKGWLPSVGGHDHISADPFFSALRGAGVSFYDTGSLALAGPVSAPWSGGAGGAY